MSEISEQDVDLPPHYYPALLQLGLTYRCNLECPHCYALYRRTRTELTLDEVKRLIDEAWELGSCKVVYSHGENLIRQDFHEIARYVADRGYFQTLMANGFYLRTQERVDALARSGIRKVMISIDSDVPEEHNANRGLPVAFDNAVAALRRLKAQPDLKVGVSMAIAARNYQRVRGVVKLAEEIGVDFVSLMQVRPNQPDTFQRYDWSTYRSVCREIYELILEYRGRIDVYTHDPFMNTLLDERIGDRLAAEDFVAHNECNVGKYMMSICPDGVVTGCNFIDRSVGNLRESPLAEIWQRLVREYSDDNGVKGPCGGCAKLASCRMGCKAFHLPWEDRFDRRCADRVHGAIAWATAEFSVA